MNDTKKIDQSGEMIDFRKLIQIMWRGRWLVLGAASIAGLIAFLITSFLIPFRYRATALITATVPEIRIEFIEKWTTQMARSDELLEMTFDELGINDRKEQQSLGFSAYMEYWGKLELEITADDPYLAADTANVWAELVYDRIYDTLGTSEEMLDALKEEITQAEADWSIAKIELDEYLSTSYLESYPVKLSVTKSTLGEYKRIIDRNSLLISEVLTLESLIEGMDPSETLNPGTSRSLFNLLGQVGTLDEEHQLLDQDDPSIIFDLSKDEALDILQRFRAALGNQTMVLMEDSTTLENQITDLAASLEFEQGQVDDLILKRNLARKTYTEWVDQLNELEIKQNQVDQTLRISTRAVPPTEADNPGILGISVFASITTGLVVMIGFILYGWWRAGEEV